MEPERPALSTHVTKYGPYAMSRNAVAEKPRYIPRTPSLRMISPMTDMVDGLRWDGADCWRILMSSVGLAMNLHMSCASQRAFIVTRQSQSIRTLQSHRCPRPQGRSARAKAQCRPSGNVADS